MTPSSTATATLQPTATLEATAVDDGETEDETPISDEFPDTVVHVVVEGDTVSALAIEYDSAIDAINRANGLNAANLIYIGQRLIIPINLPEPQETSVADEPTDTPTATPTNTPTFTPTPTPTATPVTHQVLPGDTLETIAGRYGTTVDLLAQQNNIVNVHQIDVGQILVIPTAVPPTATPTPLPTATPVSTATPIVDPVSASTVTYVVEVGDTLGEIAAQFNTTVAAIAQLNGITNPSRIFPGQELRIPSADGTASEAGRAGSNRDADLGPDAHALAHIRAGDIHRSVRRYALRHRGCLQCQRGRIGAGQWHHKLRSAEYRTGADHPRMSPQRVILNLRTGQVILARASVRAGFFSPA